MPWLWLPLEPYAYQSGIVCVTFLGWLLEAHTHCSICSLYCWHSAAYEPLNQHHLQVNNSYLKRCTKLASTNSTISPVELFWPIILAGEQNFCTMKHGTKLASENFFVSTLHIFWQSILADQKLLLQSSPPILLRCAGQACLKLKLFFSKGISARAHLAPLVTFIIACILGISQLNQAVF